ncbi:MAG TPA: OmpH family outer membrane protein [Gemmatimonadaceae bacterium]|nr:OmpH family outer membrane protein [Gemmatimonadaceae bacterium]
MQSIVRATALVAVGLALTAAPGRAQQPVPQPKIVYVNTQALLDVAPGRAAAESTYNKESAAWGDELNKLTTTIQTMISDYQKAEPTLTAAAKDARQKAIQAKQQEYQDRQNQLNQQAQARQTELMGPVMQAVRDMLDKIREENGYSLILDQSAVVDGDKNLDITDKVVARLKIAAAAKSDSSAKAVKKPKDSPLE